MIHYVVTRDHAYTMKVYLETWQRDLAGRVSFEFYEDLPYRQHIAGGTYIFSDLERLSEARIQLAQCYAEQSANEGGRILNWPAKALRRYELLKRLHERGVNSFGVFRLNESRAGMKFPVFVREEDEHTGSLSELLHNEDELAKAISDLVIAGQDARKLLIVEYCHTAEADGLFRKYSAMKIGDRLIPRHVLFSKDWVDKHPDVVDISKIGEELAYLKLNPHERELRAAFELAKIDYGRVDYSLMNGRVTIWEINTNPVIMAQPAKCDPERLPGQARSAKAMGAAFDEIDSATNGHAVGFKWDRSLMREVGIGVHRELAWAVKDQLQRVPGIAMLKNALGKR